MPPIVAFYADSVDNRGFDKSVAPLVDLHMIHIAIVGFPIYHYGHQASVGTPSAVGV